MYPFHPVPSQAFQGRHREGHTGTCLGRMSVMYVPFARARSPPLSPQPRSTRRGCRFQGFNGDATPCRKGPAEGPAGTRRPLLSRAGRGVVPAHVCGPALASREGSATAPGISGPTVSTNRRRPRYLRHVISRQRTTDAGTSARAPFTDAPKLCTEFCTATEPSTTSPPRCTVLCSGTKSGTKNRRKGGARHGDGTGLPGAAVAR